MEAQLVARIPAGPDWLYEPKWDGFRCLVFRDGEEIYLQSKAGQPLGRYFPEVQQSVKRIGARRFVLDSEIVIPVDGKLSFDDLLLRIHPAESRVKKLAAERPAVLIVFDILVDQNARSLTEVPLRERRELLEKFGARCFKNTPRVLVSPATADIREAEGWLSRAGANTDGVVAKRLSLSYQAGERTGVQKIKRLRSADCVVGGFRYTSNGTGAGSLLLGLFNPDGLLDHVGFTSGIKAGERAPLTRRLEALVEPPGFTGRAPGGPSRWSTERTGEWKPLCPELVVEVQYDHFSGGRFRHGTKLLRWRPDKPPRQCTLDQVEREAADTAASPLDFP